MTSKDEGYLTHTLPESLNPDVLDQVSHLVQAGGSGLEVLGLLALHIQTQVPDLGQLRLQVRRMKTSIYYC